MKTLLLLASQMPLGFRKIRKLSPLPIMLFCLAVSGQKTSAALYVSNLGNMWTEGGIGDIHGLFPGGSPYGNNTARFTTGAGSFSVNAVILEFEFHSSFPAGLAAPQWISIQLYQGSSLLGSFGNPVNNPTPTQWPEAVNPNLYTKYINFSPFQTITLSPFTQYSVVTSMPANSPVAAALLFDRSQLYDSIGGWVMGNTTSGNPSAVGERLVMAVDATPVPEPSTAVLWLGGFVVLICCRRSPSLGRFRDWLLSA